MEDVMKLQYHDTKLVIVGKCTHVARLPDCITAYPYTTPIYKPPVYSVKPMSVMK